MTVKEQLSASKQKIITPNKTLVGVKTEEKKRDRRIIKASRTNRLENFSFTF